MPRILRENGLSLAFFLLFAVFLAGQTLTGHASYNDEQRKHGQSPVGYLEYLGTGHNIEAIFENWESEFLQMGANVLLTAFLFQVGSAASRKLKQPQARPRPGAADRAEAPWPVRRGGWVLTLYRNSLALAFFLFFLGSMLGHAIGGHLQYNADQAAHGGTTVSLLEFLGTSTFWFQSLQNYQSEFLALGSLTVLTIFLRQEGSPQSKAVDAPNSATGH